MLDSAIAWGVAVKAEEQLFHLQLSQGHSDLRGPVQSLASAHLREACIPIQQNCPSSSRIFSRAPDTPRPKNPKCLAAEPPPRPFKSLQNPLRSCKLAVKIQRLACTQPLKVLWARLVCQCPWDLSSPVTTGSQKSARVSCNANPMESTLASLHTAPPKDTKTHKNTHINKHCALLMHQLLESKYRSES